MTDNLADALDELADANANVVVMRTAVDQRRAPGSALNLAEWRRHKAQQRVDRARASLAMTDDIRGGDAA